MPISPEHIWQHSVHELRINDLLAMAAETLMNLPAVQRRQRLALGSLPERPYPRHVYKFRALPARPEEREYVEQILRDNQLYAPTSDAFNDPFDAQADYRVEHDAGVLREQVESFLVAGGASAAIAQGLSHADVLSRPGEIAALLKAHHQETLQQIGVYCLAANPKAPLLWAHYAHEHKGIAIQFRPSRDLRTMLLHPVHYATTYPVIENYFDRRDRDLVSPLLRKSMSWSYEDEWRILRPGQPKQVFSIRPEALTGVLLGMRMSDADRAYVERIVRARDQRYRLHTRLYQAEPAAGTYDVRFRRLR